jgi:DNA-binding SARP family transcriptional activator/pimeloyl-ACP methyl ester carboxylesterase
MQEGDESLRIHMLGRFEAYARGAKVLDATWKHRKPAQLLQLIALQPSRTLHREEAAELLWPKLAPEAAFNNVYKALYRLRGAVPGRGADLVAAANERLTLATDVWTDVGAFRQAAREARESHSVETYEEALRLYGGELLPDNPYDAWTEGPRQDLSRLHVALMLELAETCIGSGCGQRASELLEEVLRVEPTEELAYRGQMRLAQESGNHAQAVRWFEACRAALERELGVPPSEETVSLYHETAGRPEAAAVSSGQPSESCSVLYTTTDDGVRIAYSVHEGPDPPLVLMPVPPGDLVADWEIPRQRRFLQLLNERRKLIRYDCRGSGQSERRIERFSVAALVADLEAVVRATSSERFALYASAHMGPAAITYAVTHPERVTRLVLFLCYADGTEFMTVPGIASFRSLAETGWDIFIQTLATGCVPAGDPESLQSLVSVLRDSMDQDVLLRFVDSIHEFTASHLLAQVRCPTLVIQRELNSWPPAFGRRLTAGIPGATLRFVDGQVITPWSQHEDAIVRAIGEFLAPADANPERRTRETGPGESRDSRGGNEPGERRTGSG